MDQQTDGWFWQIDRWSDGLMADGLTDSWMNGSTDWQMGGLKDMWIDLLIERWINRQRYGSTD